VPILAYSVLHASPGELGMIKAAQTLRFLIFAIPIGEYADKLPRRRILLAADAARFPLIAAIALLGAALPVPALVFLVGIGTVAYEVAYLSALPELIDGPCELPAANRAVETAHAAASLLGLAAAAALLAVVAPRTAIGIDAATFAVGALLTTVNGGPPPCSPAPAGRPGRGSSPAGTGCAGIRSSGR
jgi:MFS family permease